MEPKETSANFAPELSCAVRDGDFEAVQTWLDNGADIDHRDNKGRTPLMAALHHRQEAVAELLICNGANIDLGDNELNSPLMYASSTGQDKAAALMIARPMHAILVDAIKSGKVEDAVSAAKDFSSTQCNCAKFPDKDGNNALHFAAAHGLTPIIWMLVNKENINISNKVGRSPLWSAARYGKPGAVDGLLTAGADIDHPDNKKRTPLMIALQVGNKEVAELLIRNGANIDNADNWCNGSHKLNGSQKNDIANLITASEINRRLIDAIISKNSEDAVSAINEFRSTGFKFTEFTSPSRDNALHYAALHGMGDLVSMLARKENINSQNKDGRSPLALAALAGESGAAMALLKAGADINHPDNDGWTPLILAVVSGKDEVARSLITQGAALNKQGSRGETALMLASYFDQMNIIKALLAGGARIELKDSQGGDVFDWAHDERHVLDALYALGSPTPEELNSLLVEAIEHEWREDAISVAKAFVGKGDCVNFRDALGNTALHLAAAAGMTEVVSILSGNTHDINSTNNEGRTPLMVALSNGQKGVAHLLLSKGADIEDTDDGLLSPVLFAANRHAGLRTVIKTKDSERADAFASAFIKEGNDCADFIDESWNTALHDAVREGKASVISILARTTKDIDRKNKDGLSALSLAAQHGDLEAVEALLAVSADTDHANRDLRAPLMHATNHGHRDVVSLLMEHGATFDKRAEGTTA